MNSTEFEIHLSLSIQRTCKCVDERYVQGFRLFTWLSLVKKSNWFLTYDQDAELYYVLINVILLFCWILPCSLLCRKYVRHFYSFLNLLELIESFSILFADRSHKNLSFHLISVKLYVNNIKKCKFCSLV